MHLFGPCFTAPGQLLFEQLFTAWALCPGRRTLTRLWSVIPAERRRRYAAYALGPQGQMVAGRALAAPGRPSRRALGAGGSAHPDARRHLVNKSGRKVDGAGYFHDAVTSTAVAHNVTAWGLNVVVLALRLPSSWGGEPLALPVMVCLHPVLANAA